MSIHHLAQYIDRHTVLTTKPSDTSPTMPVKPDLHVVIRNNPQASILKGLIRTSYMGFNKTNLNPFNGEPHGYAELGQWLGNEGRGLGFAALVGYLNLANMMAPDMSSMPPKMADEMLAAGFVGIEPVVASRPIFMRPSIQRQVQKL